MIPLLFTLTLGLLAVLQIEGYRLWQWRKSFLASLPCWQLKMPAETHSFSDELWANLKK